MKDKNNIIVIITVIVVILIAIIAVIISTSNNKDNYMNYGTNSASNMNGVLTNSPASPEELSNIGFEEVTDN